MMTMMNKLNIKVRIGIYLLIFLIGFVGSYMLFQAVNDWFQTHYFQFNKVLTVILKPPFEIKKREKEVKVEKVVLDYPEEIDTPIEQYICEKFGPYDCKTALAVAKAESGLREDAIGINTNNTIDVGIFQINTIHFKKDGCNIKDLVDAKKNVDCAYQLWQEQGWTPWVAYNTGRYLVKLGTD